jgi:hypothetical protein
VATSGNEPAKEFLPASRAALNIDSRSRDRASISRVLDVYKTGYQNLDATTVASIWHGLDTRALQRAFSTLSRQSLSFDHCQVNFATVDRATADCSGVLEYSRRVGDPTPQSRRLEWSIDLQRIGDDWVIARVNAR